MLNAYRVLLTRARQGIIILSPKVIAVLHQRDSRKIPHDCQSITMGFISI